MTSQKVSNPARAILSKICPACTGRGRVPPGHGPLRRTEKRFNNSLHDKCLASPTTAVRWQILESSFPPFVPRQPMLRIHLNQIRIWVKDWKSILLQTRVQIMLHYCHTKCENLFFGYASLPEIRLRTVLSTPPPP